jgi:PAS domain S-box-containing protein
MDGSTAPVILCVDDDKVTLRGLERALVNNGYSVLTAGSAAQALATLQHAKPDLILLDAIMPDMDGYEICARVRSNQALADVPVIFVTAQEEGEDTKKALSLGAVDYLIKPFQRETLLRMVAQHLQVTSITGINGNSAHHHKQLLHNTSVEVFRSSVPRLITEPVPQHSVDTLAHRQGSLVQAEEVERLVQERTATLIQANAVLHAELSKRQHVEATLHQREEELDRRIAERTAEVEKATQVLRIQLDERQHAIETLTRALDECERLVTALPDPVFILDSDGTLKKWDKKLEIVSGFSPEELLDRPVTMLFPKDEHTLIRQAFSIVSEVGTSAIDGHLLRKDGTTVPYHWKNAIYKDPMGQPIGLIGIGRDMTAQKQAEVALQQAKETAEQSNRAKSEFLANMSHEIRTPMNGIIGMNDLLLDTALTAEQLDYVETVKSSAETLLSLLNDILDFSKIEARKLDLENVEFSLHDMLGDTVKALAFRAHQKEIELLYEISPDVSDVMIGDPTRLRQVLTNLIGNALKFTERGEVMVKIETVQDLGEDVTLRFAVQDTGIGIPKDKQRRVFESFSQADASVTRKYGGTGLGLAISVQLVRLMHGHMWLESEENQGSTFFFTARFAKGTPKELPASVQFDALQGVRILVVEDNATHQRLLNTTLTRWKMEPKLAAHAEEALTQIQQATDQGTPFPFILLDSSLPGDTTLILAQQIKAEASPSSLLFLMLTSTEQKEDRAQYEALGVTGFITKPLRSKELQGALLRALGKEVPEPRKTKRPFARQSRQQLRLLVAEDNPVNQKLAIRVLQKWNHEVVIARNGQEAYDMLLRDTAFDAVLMDVEMPVMNGLEATAKIRTHEQTVGTRIPIIAMTAHAMVGDKERCLTAGMDGYVTKPLRPDELFTILESIVVHVHRDEGSKSAEYHTSQEETFDRQELLALLDGDVALLTELTELFWENSPALIAQMRSALVDGDPHTLTYAAHTLKGSVGNFAAKRALALIAEVEQISMGQDSSRAKAALDALEAELFSLRTALSSLKEELAA